MALKSVTPKELQDEPAGYSATDRSREVHEVPPNQILERGQTFFNQVYGKVSERVMGQLDNCGTEDLGLMARSTYGYILSNTNVLNAAETSWVLIAGLVPQDVSFSSFPLLRQSLPISLSVLSKSIFHRLTHS